MNENWFEKIENYIKGGMSHEEQLLFESELEVNEELYAAFNIYKEIETQMRTHAEYSGQEALLRKSLEKLNEEYFGNKSQQDADPESEKATPIYTKKDQRPGEGFNEVRKINPWKWLTAASLTGFIFLGVVWWYSHKQDDIKFIANKKEPDSQIVTNKQMDKPENITAPKKSSQQVKARAFDTVSTNMSLQNRKREEKLKREKLFAKNFKPDNLPAQIPAPLEDPSAYYKAKKPEKAIQEYKNLLADIKDAENLDLVARGEDDQIELITFYAHYYLAQSYMSVNNITQAIQELKNAIAKAPDKIWKSKAHWYIALAYLKTNQVHRAETLLKEVANNEQANDYKQRAIKLVDELKKENKYN